MPYELTSSGLTHLAIAWTVLTISMTIAALIVPGVSIRGGILSHFLVAGLFALVTTGAVVLVHVIFGRQGDAVAIGLGFFSRLVVMAVLLRITSLMSDRLFVKSLLRAFLAALVVSFTSVVVEHLITRLMA